MSTFTDSRRGFLKGSLLGAGALAAGMAASPGAKAAEPIVRTGKPYMKLSLAAYSFRDSLVRSGTPEQLAAAKMRLEDFITYCAEMGLDGTELTSYYFPQDVTDEYLLKLKEQTFRLGLDISGTAIGNDFCLPEGEKRDETLKLTRDWIDYAAFMGAPVIRIFAGKVPEGESEDVVMDRCVAAINESVAYAATKGVFLGLENHGGIVASADTMLEIIKRVEPSPWFGVNFDGGNFATDDPYRDLAKIAPYTVNAQIKVSVKPNGKKERADFKRVIGILKDAGYRGYIVLEYEEDEPPREAIPALLDELREAIHG